MYTSLKYEKQWGLRLLPHIRDGVRALVPAAGRAPTPLTLPTPVVSLTISKYCIRTSLQKLSAMSLALLNIIMPLYFIRIGNR